MPLPNRQMTLRSLALALFDSARTTAGPGKAFEWDVLGLCPTQAYPRRWQGEIGGSSRIRLHFLSGARLCFKAMFEP